MTYPLICNCGRFLGWSTRQFITEELRCQNCEVAIRGRTKRMADELNHNRSKNKQ